MATVTGLTASRMQEIIDRQVLSGAVDLSGDLIFTRDDSTTFNAGKVKGDKGDSSTYPLGRFANQTVANYIRIAEVDGIGPTSGASLQFLISNIGGLGIQARGTALVHVTQRGSGLISVVGWSWGFGELDINDFSLYTKQLGPYNFEIWAKIGPYQQDINITVLGSYNTILTLDEERTTSPGAIYFKSITPQDVGPATTTKSGLVMLASTSDTTSGNSNAKAVTPASLNQAYGQGIGYRLAYRFLYASSTTLIKAMWGSSRAIRVIVVGGGGGGGGSTSAATGQNSHGSGGGGGGYAEKLFTNMSLVPSSLEVTVGAGATAASGDGGSGGTSSFGSLVSASGGQGGFRKTSSVLGGYIPGGVPGVGLDGDILIGGSGGSSGFGRDIWCHGGPGGASALGGGGGAVGSGTGSTALAGAPGQNYGGGGGGAATNGSGPAANGGAGANGAVIVEVYR